MDDNVSLHCAALAYYTVFSIAPLLIISIAISGFIFGEHSSRGAIFNAIQGLLGETGALAVESMVHSAARNHHAGVLATWAGILTLFFGASGVFSQLESSLNLIWRVEAVPGKALSTYLRRRLFSFSMILVIGFLLLVSLLANAAVAAMGKYLADHLPGGEFHWHVLNSSLSFVLVTVLFGALFKYLPDVRLAWRDVWLGAAITSFLFEIGKLLIGLYLGKSTIASTYGAAGSVIVVLLWVFYSSMILFFGAEFTRAYVRMKRKEIMPKSGSQFIKSAA